MQLAREKTINFSGLDEVAPQVPLVFRVLASHAASKETNLALQAKRLNGNDEI